MAISTEKLPDLTTVIRVSGRFDFSVRNDFQDGYSDVSGGNGLILDLGDTEYIDSSALGMLLLLKEHAGKAKSHVVIRNCTPEVRRILSVSKFDQMFEIAE